MDYSDVDPKAMITYISHEQVYTCDMHGEIKPDSERKTICAECEKLPEDERPDKEVKGNLERVKHTVPIGEFHKRTREFIRDHYRQHRWQVIVLGKGWCLGDRDPDRILELDPMSALVVRDYTDRISAEYNNSAMSTGMGGGNATVGMEGFLYHHKNAENEIEMNWYGFLSDWKQQDSRTSYGNLFKFVKHLKEDLGLLQNKDSVLYIRSDGCAKQYKCANALRLVGWICEIFKIRIDWMITAPHHGKNLVDAIAGKDKHDLANAYIRGMDPAQRDEFFRMLSEARKAEKFLSNRPEIRNWKKPKFEDRKNKNKAGVDDGKRTLNRRKYEVSNYDKIRDGKGIPVANCLWEVKKPQFNSEYPGGVKTKGVNKYTTKVGLKEMFHFRFIPEMEKGLVAVRRVPCLCDECYSVLSKPWNPDIAAKKQVMFRPVMGCRMEPLMGSLNNWNVVRVTEKSKNSVKQKEVAVLFQDAFEYLETEIEREIQTGDLGIVIDEKRSRDNPNGFQLVEWLSVPFPLQKETVIHGCGSSTMQEGTIVVKCNFWERIPNQEGKKEGDWYEKPQLNIRDRIVPAEKQVWIRNVICGSVPRLHLGEGTATLDKCFLRSWNEGKQKNVALITADTLKDIEFERSLRKKWDAVDLFRCLDEEDVGKKKEPVKETESKSEKFKKERKLNTLLNKTDEK